MNVVVFSGPTLSPHEVAVQLEATCLPPAAEGDVLRALGLDPHVIVLIDGAFRRTPAVWHNELLLALSSGVRVIGAASMGALRALELEPFGMEGVGRIYELFRSGELEDDDEVAVSHAPAELGFQPLSLALVDVRCALQDAVRRGAVPSGAAASALAALKRLPYPERTLWAIQDQEDAAPALTWLRAHLGSQKRADAMAALACSRGTRPRQGPATARPHETPYWRRARAAAGSAGVDGPVSTDDILNELRLSPQRYMALERDVKWKVFAFAPARSERVDPLSAEASRTRFRERRGLQSEADLSAWRTSQGLTPAALDDLILRELAAARAAADAKLDIQSAMLDALRLGGAYAAFAARAAAKRSSGGPSAPTPVPDALITAFQQQHGLAAMTPDSLAWALGLDDRHALAALLVREHLFRCATEMLTNAIATETGAT